MKKITVILLILTMLLGLTSCALPLPAPEGAGTSEGDDIGSKDDKNPVKGDGPSLNPDGTVNYVDASEKDYITLDRLVNEKRDSMTVRITTDKGGIPLTAEYTITTEKVIYSIEQLTFFPADGNLADLPENVTETLTGECAIKDGKILTPEGLPVEFPSYDELSGNFNFDEKNFRNAKRGVDTFHAEVASVYGFLGIYKSIDEMKVDVSYTESVLSSITLSYTDGDTSVNISYSF